MGTINKLCILFIHNESQNIIARRKVTTICLSPYKELRVPISVLCPRSNGKESSRENQNPCFLPPNLQLSCCSLCLFNSSWWHESPHDCSALLTCCSGVCTSPQTAFYRVTHELPPLLCLDPSMQLHNSFHKCVHVFLKLGCGDVQRYLKPQEKQVLHLCCWWGAASF